MAQKQEDIILNIEINNEAAIKKIAEFTVKIEENKKEQEKLKKAVKDNAISNEEYIKSMAAAKAEVDYNKKAIKDLSKEIQNNLTIEREHGDSLKVLKAELSNANAAFDKLSEAERTNTKAGLDLQKKIDGITDKLKTEEAALDNHRRSVGDYETSTRSLRKELKEYTTQMQQMTLEGKRGTEEFAEMQKKAGELRTAIDATSMSIKNAANNTQAIAGLNQALQGVVGSFGAYQAVIGLADQKNEQLAKTMKNLQVVMAALMSLQAIHATLLKQSAMMTLANNVAVNASKIAYKLFGVSIGQTTTAFKLLRTALIATGIGAIVVGIGMLIANFGKLTDWVKKSADGMSGFGKALDKIKEVAMGVWEVLKTHILMPFKTLGKLITGDFKGALEEVKKGYDVVGNYQKGALEQMEKNQKNAAKKRLAKRRKDISDALLDEAKMLEKELEIAKAKGISAEELYNREKEILNKKATAHRIALKNIKDINSDEYKELSKIIDEFEQELLIKDASYEKRKKEEAQKAAQEAIQREKEKAKATQDAIRQAQDAALAIVEEGVEKQRQTINRNYDRQIEDLKQKLAEDKKLTEEARAAINSTIINLDKKREQELQKISDDEIQKRIDNETKLIEMKLQAVRKGTEAEYQLRLQQMEKQKEAELKNLEEKIKREVETGILSVTQAEEMKQALLEKYHLQNIEIENQRRVETLAAQKEALELEWMQRLEAVQEGTAAESQIRLEQAQAEHEALAGMDAETKALMFSSNTAYEKALLDSRKKMTAAEKVHLNTLSDVAVKQIEIAQTVSNAFSDMLSTFAEQNEELAEFAKAVALFNIGLDIAKAIAAIPSMAAMGDPYTYALRVATAIATVMASAAKAYQLLKKESQPKAPKFSHGGLVTGAGSGTSDNIPAYLSSGESVMTANTTQMFSPVLSALNQIGGGVPISVQQAGAAAMGEDVLKNIIKDALKDMPPQYVAVTEIRDVQNRVEVVEAIGNV